MLKLSFGSYLPSVIESPEHLWQRLSQSVQQETFTPFLGAGASSLRPDRLSEPPWDEVSERILLLRDHLPEEDQQYLDSMAKEHRISLGRTNSSQEFRPRSPQDAALFELQKALARLGSHLVKVFGKEMLQTRQCVSEVLDYQVPLSDPDRADLLNLLFDAVDAAKDVRQQAARESGEPRLEAEAIYEKLLVLVCRMCPHKAADQCSEVVDRCKEHYGEINELRRVGVDLKTQKTIRLDELSWLADLLWHTLRYHLPAYPTTAELAFQLSLMIGVTGYPQLRRGELAQIAELQANYENQVEKIRRWFEFCEHKNRPPSDFHLGIAAALQYQFERRRDLEPWPIAFVTNYDRALEKAFEHLGLKYHVVFPLLVGWATESVSITWVFKTIFPPDSTSAPPGPRDCTDWESAEGPDNLVQGPIVIKLHGSPLEPLPDAKDIGYPRSQLQHWIVLSESSYLATIVGRESYPKWIEKELGGTPRRALWFLGYSISDWNIRLRLYEHLLHTEEAVQTKGGRPMRLAIDRRFDALRAAVLGPLQVTIYITDLLAFGTALKRIPEVRRILEKQIALRTRESKEDML